MSRLVIMSVLVAVLAAGCSSAAEPPALPPVSASGDATPAATPSAVPVSVPSAAQEPTPEGAAAFARYWFDTLNRAAAGGDTGQLRELGHPQCEACRAFADSIDFLHTQGGGIRGGEFTLVLAESPSDDDSTSAIVTVLYDVTATDQLAKDGSVAKRSEALEAVNGQMNLVRDGSTWLLQELVTL